MSEVVVWISKSGGFTHVMATSSGETADDAMMGVATISEWIGKGRERLFRVRPQVASEKNFETDVIENRGFVRFSFSEKEGIAA